MSLKSFLNKVGHGLENAVNAVIHDPLPTLVGIGLMSVGVPPVWAGAASGATSAAEHGGNILEGAAKGAAMGYVGQQTSSYLGSTGTNPILTGAGTGAAIGATGAVLSGQTNLQSIAQNALTGAAVGGVTGYFVNKNGSTTYSYDDGSTLTYNTDGTTSATPSGTVNAPVSDVNPPPESVTNASINSTANSIVKTGFVNEAGASVLAQNGYSATDVSNLIKQGYTAGELVDMASTGVPAKTLSSLGNSQFSEGTINSLLKNNVSANDIAHASDLVTQGKVNVNTATSLLRNGADVSTIDTIVNSGKADQASYLMDKGVNSQTVKSMINNNVNLNEANNQLSSGRVTAQQVNQGLSPIQQTQIPPGTSNVAHVETNVVQPDSSKIYLNSQGNLVSESVQNGVKTTSTYGNLNNGTFLSPEGNIVDSAGKTIAMDVGKGNYMDTKGNITDMFGKIKTPAINTASISPGTQVASNEPFRVDVSGRAGTIESPDVVNNQYRTPGTKLATIDEVDSGKATWNSAANAWEVKEPTVAPVTPIINEPIVNPNANAVVTPANPVTQPSNLQVANVDVTQPPVVPQEPVKVPNVPIVTQPTTPVISQPTTTQVTPEKPKEETPLSPLTQVEIPPSKPIPEVVVQPETPVTIPTTIGSTDIKTPTTTPTVNVANPPIVDYSKTNVPTTHYGTYSWGNAPQVQIPTGLNPGWINPPVYYTPQNAAQSQYYWGTHPYQPGPTFDPTLYNTLPQAPTTPWGMNTVPRNATAQEIINMMGLQYPLLGTNTTTGPVVPT